MTTVPARPRRRRARIVVVAIVLVLLLLVVGVVTWSNIVMQGDRGAALKAWRDPAISISSTGHSVIMSPAAGGNGTGLVFIPGAKVDPYAYLYKLAGIVDAGVTVVITEPILNLAFFDQRPLATFTGDVPGITRWFVGGHSLGGVRACQLAAPSQASPQVAGLVLFGSYCANDLSDSGLTVLSIAGSRDGLSTPQKIADAKHLLPASTDFVVIEGGDHAGFGDYGEQPGDDSATITSAQQRAAITRALVRLLTPASLK